MILYGFNNLEKIISSDVIKIYFYDWSLIFNIGQLLIILFVKSSPFREIALINSPSIKYWKAISQPLIFGLMISLESGRRVSKNSS